MSGTTPFIGLIGVNVELRENSHFGILKDLLKGCKGDQNLAHKAFSIEKVFSLRGVGIILAVTNFMSFMSRKRMSSGMMGGSLTS
ncbi:hypothetical protein RIR_jg31250.t1 [Rhizophagus irregularis DAOM 181602=DAOM 197198]|nr:hypothetical protein RIR_jg31250.t1 [Rhizophagus irregularis DAOM 181602=DAOM 197198]